MELCQSIKTLFPFIIQACAVIESKCIQSIKQNVYHSITLQMLFLHLTFNQYIVYIQFIDNSPPNKRTNKTPGS